MNPANGNDLTFEQALTELERIVRDLEEGRSGLEESLAQYESGVSLLKQCHEQLQKAEQRIALLTGMDAEGKPITRPFAHSASASQAEAVAQPPPSAQPEAAPKPRRTPVEANPPPDEEDKPKPPGGLLWD